MWRQHPAHLRLSTLLAIITLPGIIFLGPIDASAQGPLRPDHPQSYVVQPGDTLWDIAGRFLREPWRWRDVWHANPGVANPNRIYPGDVLVVDYSDGSPRIQRAGGGGMRTVKLSPRVRVTDVDREIPTIPLDAVAPFLSRPVVTEAREIDDAPYVVGFPEEQIIGGLGNTVYVRSILRAGKDRWEVLRPGEAYRDPDTDELLGYEASSVASARLEQLGDPATLVITRSNKEVQIGDRVRPARDEEPIRSFFPVPAPPGTRGKIISVLNGVARDRIAVGQVLAVYRGGELRRDPVKGHRSAWNWRNESPANVSFWNGDWQPDGWARNGPDPNDPLPLRRRYSRADEQYIVPDSRSGVVMVFRVFPKVSFALVMFANKAMHVGEIVAPPQAL